MSPTRQPLRRPKVVSPWASEKPKREALRAEKREAILRAAAICFSQRGMPLEKPTPTAVEVGASDAPKWLFEASSDTNKVISMPAQGQENTEAKVIKTPEADNAGGPVEQAKHSEEAMK